MKKSLTLNNVYNSGYVNLEEKPRNLISQRGRRRSWMETFWSMKTDRHARQSFGGSFVLSSGCNPALENI